MLIKIEFFFYFICQIFDKHSYFQNVDISSNNFIIQAFKGFYWFAIKLHQHSCNQRQGGQLAFIWESYNS